MEKKFNLFMGNNVLGVGFKKEENSLYKEVKKFDFFTNVNKSKSNDYFYLLDGPPYANGSCHMGHALNKVWKDFIVKNNWFQNKKVLFNPGWDCHGLPIENQVEKSLVNDKNNLSLDDKKNLCSYLALKSVAKQKQDFLNLGITADWDNPYLTKSFEMKRHSYSLLSSMFKQNLLIYKKMPVHHCPVCASSLAAAELEYKELEKESLYFLVPTTKENTFLLVWTTTPWTLPANSGIAYNKNYNYVLLKNTNKEQFIVVQKEFFENSVNSHMFVNYVLFTENYNLSSLSSCELFTNGQTPFLHADFVLDNQTGFVHIAPAHGPEDFELFEKNNLPYKTVLDKYGKYFDYILPEILGGKKAHNQFVKQVFKEYLTSLGLLFHYSVNQEEVAVCWRHKTPVFYNASYQVFLDLDPLKDRAKDYLKNSCFSSNNKEHLEQMLLSRPFWVLSRQRYWGTSMNLLVDKNTNTLSPLSLKSLELSYNNDLQGIEKLLKDNPNLSLINDVLDVWFDSGAVAFAMKENYLENGLQVSSPDLVLEGKDQFRGWFQSLFWLSLVVQKEHNVLYKNVLSHGFILDKNKMKFSKSSKNGMTAKEATIFYNPDVVRIWASFSQEGKDGVFNEENMKLAGQYYKRFRLTLRFLTTAMPDNVLLDDYFESNFFMNNFSEEEKDFYYFVMNKTNDFQNNFISLMNKYDFKNAGSLLFEFCNVFLSSFVFETLKPQLYLYPNGNKNKDLALYICYQLLKTLYPIVGVFSSFVSFEFYQKYPLNKNNLFQNNYNKIVNHNYNYDWDTLLFVQNSLNKELEKFDKKQATTPEQCSLFVYLTKDKKDNLQRLFNVFDYKFYLGVSNLFLFENNKEYNNQVLIVGLKNNVDYQKCPRCWYYFNKNNLINDLCNDCDKNN